MQLEAFSLTFLTTQVRYDELKKADKSSEKSSEKSDKSESKSKSKSRSDNRVQCYMEASEEVMGPVVRAIQPVLSSKIWDELTSVHFYTRHFKKK